MTDLSESVNSFLVQYEKSGNDISQIGTTTLVEAYYRSIGVNESMSTNDWLIGLAFKEYPVYTEARRLIREARELNERWHKNFKKTNQNKGK